MTVQVRQLDVASLASVGSFAAGLLSDHDRLDVLVNNAGIMACPLRQNRRRVEAAVRNKPPGPLPARRAGKRSACAGVRRRQNDHVRGKTSFPDCSRFRDAHCRLGDRETGGVLLRPDAPSSGAGTALHVAARSPWLAGRGKSPAASREKQPTRTRSSTSVSSARHPTGSDRDV